MGSVQAGVGKEPPEWVGNVHAGWAGNVPAWGKWRTCGPGWGGACRPGWVGKEPLGGRGTYRPGRVGSVQAGVGKEPLGWVGNVQAWGGWRTCGVGWGGVGWGVRVGVSWRRQVRRTADGRPGPTHLQSAALARGRGGMSARSTVRGAPGPK
ncbi:hypothetical protein GCM10010449_20780 [Streptomyces rectiviolaceus]|uniref:Uncharacterized protein n=1 Tax=Streptomyces rectiviolaceus TaxID=332591 RepID=A0ABP6ME35_9ACTN